MKLGNLSGEGGFWKAKQRNQKQGTHLLLSSWKWRPASGQLKKLKKACCSQTANRGLQHSFTMLFKQEAQGNPRLCTLSLAATTTGSSSSKGIQHHGTTNPAQKAKPDDAGIICSGCHYFFHSVASKQTSEKSNTPRRATHVGNKHLRWAGGRTTTPPPLPAAVA